MSETMSSFGQADPLDVWLMKFPHWQMQDYLLQTGSPDDGLRTSLLILAAMLLFPFLICGGCCSGMLAFDFAFSGM